MRYGLIGEKLGHSFSKEIHERIAEYSYDLIPLDKQAFVSFMQAKAFQAINVTIPYKKAVLPYLDELDTAAKMIGAVNTIVNQNGILKGYNTDFSGFQYMLRKHHVSMLEKKVLVIGNGGASAAIQAVVKSEKAGCMVVVDIVAGNGAISYEEMFSTHLDAQIIINTSPIGMYPKIGNSPLDLTRFPNCKTVIDVIYNPITTRLCLQAKHLGLQHINGLEMLIAQAKQSVEFFLDKKIDDKIIDTIYQDMIKERCNIVLIGMPSAGKSTIGKLLAKAMHKEFIDIDEYIVESEGRSIAQIFAKEKEAGFRFIEASATKELAKRNNTVIATGGGIVKDKANMNYLQQNGILFFIDRSIDKLTSNDPTRPLSNSKQALVQMEKQRRKLYQTYADVTIKNNDDLDSAIKEICSTYQTILNKNMD